MIKDQIVDVDLKKWILCRQEKKDLKRRIFCFPYSGGGASIFREWNNLFDNHTEICPIQYPGRENRFREALHTDIRELTTEISKVIELLADYPYFFFGHSLGGIVAYDLCHLLSEMNIPLPEAVFISASRPPHLGPLIPKYHNLSDEEFIKIIRTYGGTNEKIFQDKSLMEIYLPILKSDFALLSNYNDINNNILNVPIFAMGGQNDPIICTEVLEFWKEKSTKECCIEIFEGDHFYINQTPQIVTDFVKSKII